MTTAKLVELKDNELPKGWAASTLGEIASYVQRGKSPKYTEHSELPVVNQKCVRWHGVDRDHVKYIHPEQFEKWEEKRFLQNGDLLWNSTGTGTIGRAAIAQLKDGERLVVDSHVTIVRSAEGIEPKYVHYWVMGPAVQNSIAAMQSGSTNQVELSKGAVESTPIPVAPLEQQKRIVAKIEELFSHIDAGIEALNKAKQLLKQYRQSVLKAAVTGEHTKEWREQNKCSSGELIESLEEHLSSTFSLYKKGKNSGWIEIVLKDISTRVSVGHVGKTTEFYCEKDEGIPFLRSQNVKPGRVIFEGTKYITPAFHKSLKKSQLQEGDLLIVRVGANRGDATVLPEIKGEINCANIVFARTPKSVSGYLDLYFQSELWTGLVDGLTTGTAQGVINTKTVEKVQLDIPPLKEIKEIVNQMEIKQVAISRLENEINSQLLKAGKNKQSILASAFSGRLIDA